MNIKDIAKIAGVSISTVSKIINNKDESIRAETRERVLQIVKEYNYVPFATNINPSAKTFLIGVIVQRDFSCSPYFQGIVSEAQKNGYCIILCESKDSSVQELKNILILCNSRVDGVIWEPLNEKSCTYSSNFNDFKIPYITIQSENNGLNIDYEKLGYMTTEHMISYGHKNIACLLSTDFIRKSFLDGYRKCLFENNIHFDENLVFSQVSPLLLHQIGRRNVSGVISADFFQMRNLLEKIIPLQYRIPKNLSLLTLKNQNEDILCYPSVSCLAIPFLNFGEYLCRKILNKVENQALSNESFAPQIVLTDTQSLSIPYSIDKPEITVVGSLNIDIYLNVCQLPFSGKTVSTSTSSTYPGGKGMNQAVGVSKLGHPVNLIGKLGTDFDSDIIYATLKKYQINQAGVCRTEDADTGKAYILAAPNGESMISILSGANSRLSPSDIIKQEYLFEKASYCLIQTEIPLATVYEACLTAHRHHAKTIVKPSACGQLSDELLREIDILVPNEDELRELCPMQDSLEQQAEHLLNKGIPTIIVTLGARGCYVLTDKLKHYYPAATFPAVDNTGASDAFISALASYLLYGCTLQRAIEIALYASGFSITCEGVIPSLIDQNRLEAHFDQME